MTTAGLRELTTPLELPNSPNEIDVEMYERMALVYNAIWLLATQIDRFIVPLEGIYLRDTQVPPHYWRVTVSNLGVLQTADTGTVPPQA